jgi:hypothetical protein
MQHSVEWAGLVYANAARMQALVGTSDAGLKTALGMEMSTAIGCPEVIAKASVAGALPGQVRPWPPSCQRAAKKPPR